LVVADAGSTLTSAGSMTVLKILPYQLASGVIAATNTSEALPDAPSGYFLVKDGSIVDGVAYEGMIVHGTSSHIGAGAAFDFPTTGQPLDFWITDQFSSTVAGTLVRINFTGNNALDWRYSTSAGVTPGSLTFGPGVTGP
jgi:hypothetical protein